MAYEKTTWNEGIAPGMSAENLNKLETQYEQALADAATAAATAIAAKLKAGSVTDTTNVDGLIEVLFGAEFASTPVIVVTPFGDVDYYPVITVKGAAGFTVKWLRTYHKHSQANTGAEATHTHSFSDTSSSAGGHSHTQGVTGGPSATETITHIVSYRSRYCSSTSGGSTDTSFWAITPQNFNVPHETHTHTNPNTSTKASHTHSVSGTTGASGSHSHTNPDTSEVNAGNLLASTEVTFSYIAMIP